MIAERGRPGTFGARNAKMGLEPLPLRINEGDQRDLNLELVLRDASKPVATLLWQTVHDGDRVQRGQTPQFVDIYVLSRQMFIVSNTVLLPP